MAIQSSYQTVAEQIINYNTNAIELLSKIDELVQSSDPSLTVDVVDKSGVVTQMNLPSVGFLKSEIIRLNNNIESIYNINGSGSLIQTSSNVYKKVVTVDLNKEPNDITSLDSVANFTISKNWFFDSLLNPQLFIELDLSGKVEDNVTACKSRRYIVEFEDAGGELTTNGSSALNAFNNLYRNKTNIDITEFTNWLATTPGVKNSTNVVYDEQDFNMEANRLSYNGQYSVLKVEEDTLNNILWYHLDTLKYVNTIDNNIAQLSIGMELIINVEKSTTRYKIIDISTSMVNPRVRLERLEGLDPIPVGVGTLKVYSPVFQNKTIRISVGYDERNVLFIKPINTDNHILSKNWSGGIGYWTSDLKLKSGDSDNGMSMAQYYVSKVDDYGTVLRDLTKKNIPNIYAIKPNTPVLTLDSFKVVQINKHLTDTNGSTALKAKNNQMVSLKSEIAQLNDAIITKNKQLIATRFSSESAKSQFENEIVKLNKKKESSTKLLSSLVSDIIAATNEVGSSDTAKYRIRGFWNIPPAATAVGTPPQEIVQFRVQYRYLTVDGRETATDTYNLSTDGSKKTAVFSNWNTFLTEPRKRLYDVSTNTYSWEAVNVGDGNTINTNQLDLPISPNESIEIMVQSISEVGFPDSYTESDWSASMVMEFPSELNVGTIDIESIKMDAMREDIKTQIESDYAAKGLDTHLADTTIINNTTYDHKAEKVLSGFKDSNNIDMSVYEYFKFLTSKIEQLEDKINKVSGELEVVLYRNNDQIIVKNGAEITYNVECEDYLDKYTGTGVQTGRVYVNSIYVIKDFLLKIRNKSSQSPLGLLSNRDYSSADIYNASAPQTFWANDQNELITSNITGSTKTQLNNQFVWMVNYEGITQSNAVKLSDNIGNSFATNKNNSITNILSSSEFNLGYNEKSVLAFVNNNNSLLDSAKWIDPSTSIASTTKLLSTVHPVVSDLDNIVEVNSEKIKTIGVNDNDDINIPLNVYFKMNAMDNTKTGKNYQYVNLNEQTQSVKHIKKVKFFMESNSDNRPFIFTVVFVLNRNKTIVKKTISNVPSMTESMQETSTKQRKSKTSTYTPNNNL